MPCPAGKAVAGGFNVPDESVLKVFVFHEGPAEHGFQWEMAVGNNGTTTVRVTGYAVCLR